MKNKLLYNFFRIALVISASNVYAATSLIDVGHIQGVPSGAVGSGNGTLDILLFTQGVNDNAISGSNFDDGNTDLSSGINNGDADFWDESYVTSGKKLKDFYRLNFGPATTSAELMFSLDLNETGNGLAENYFSTIDIIVNPDANSLGFDVNEGYPDPLNTDVQAAQQNAIDQVFSGGGFVSNNDS